MQKIVTIGGGTGHYQMLRGLKTHEVSLDAVVSVFDNGGSTGRLRDEFVDFGILSPGDIRNCLLALTDESKLKHMVEIFEHRFPDTKGGLSKHNVGNLIIAAAQQRYGRVEGIQIVAREILGITRHRVLPTSPDITDLFAKTESGEVLQGQVNVSYPSQDSEIKRVWLDPKAFVYNETAQAIRDADAIVICPGDLYGSIIPNFLVNGVPDVLQESKSRIIYICNLVTKQGTKRFRASDFVKEIEDYAKRKIDIVVCNTREPSKIVVDKYKNEDSFFVEPDLQGSRVIKEDLLDEQPFREERVIARHHREKTARVIMEIISA